MQYAKVYAALNLVKNTLYGALGKTISEKDLKGTWGKYQGQANKTGAVIRDLGAYAISGFFLSKTAYHEISTKRSIRPILDDPNYVEPLKIFIASFFGANILRSLIDLKNILFPKKESAK